MADSHTEAEKKLAKLAQRLREGWAVRHAVTDPEKAAVRQAVKQQWEQTQAPSPSKEQSVQQMESKETKAQKSKTPKQAKDKDKERGHGH